MTKERHEMPREWYSRGLRFHCTQCGNCCTGAPGIVDFTPAELEAMAKRLGFPPEGFLERYARRRRGGWCLKEVEVDGAYDCIFLRREQGTGRGLCAVYEARPAQCRTWPFWPENLQSREAWHDAAGQCPGMQDGGWLQAEPPQASESEGRVYSLEEIRRLREGGEV